MTTLPPLFSRPFVTLLVAQTVFGLGFSTFLMLPTYLATTLDASPWQIGLVTSLFGLSSMIFMPLVGHWADRTHRLPWAIAGAGLTAVAALGFIWVREIGTTVYVLRFVHGFGNALELVAAGALVTDLVPTRRLGQGLGLFGVTMLSTNALAPAIAEPVAARWGWGPVFGMASAAALCGMLLLALIREPPHDRAPGQGATLLQVALHKRSLWFIGVTGLMGSAFAALFTFVQPLALDLGATRISSFFIGYTLSAAAVRVFLGGLADRIGKAPVCLAMIALYGVPIAFSANLHVGSLPWLGAVFGLAHGLLYPTLSALIVEPVGSNERAKVYALFMASFNAGWAGGSLALGWVAERAGYPAVFWIATGGVALAWLLFLSASEVRDELRAKAA